VPLVAIATPIEYTRNPLRVFELDFEENLRVVRYCVKYGKRIVFPSTSEVYGMCDDEVFDEDASKLVLEAAPRPRDLGLRPGAGSRVHAVPPVQLDRAAAR